MVLCICLTLSQYYGIIYGIILPSITFRFYSRLPTAFSPPSVLQTVDLWPASVRPEWKEFKQVGEVETLLSLRKGYAVFPLGQHWLTTHMDYIPHKADAGIQTLTPSHSLSHNIFFLSFLLSFSLTSVRNSNSLPTSSARESNTYNKTVHLSRVHMYVISWATEC